MERMKSEVQSVGLRASGPPGLRAWGVGRGRGGGDRHGDNCRFWAIDLPLRLA